MSAVAEIINKKPGLKPGQKHAGSFAVGYDPRRGVNGSSPARRNLLEEVSQAAALHVADGIVFLAETFRDVEQPMKFRIQAVSELLSRGVETPVSMQIHKQIVESAGGKSPLDIAQAASTASLSEEELQEIVHAHKDQVEALDRVNGAGVDSIEDAQFTEVPDTKETGGRMTNSPPHRRRRARRDAPQG